MHGKVDTPIGKLFFYLEREEPLAAHLCERPVLNLVTTGRNDDNLDVLLANSVGFYQPVTRLTGLCERQGTPTCTDLERFCLHWLLSVLREFKLEPYLTSFYSTGNAAKDIRFIAA